MKKLINTITCFAMMLFFVAVGAYMFYHGERLWGIVAVVVPLWFGSVLYSNLKESLRKSNKSNGELLYSVNDIMHFELSPDYIRETNVRVIISDSEMVEAIKRGTIKLDVVPDIIM